MKDISLLRLKVVREKAVRYGPSNVSTPEDVVEIAKKLDLGSLAEEVAVLITLDVKMNVTGIFKVSHGTLNASLLHPREIYKRAVLQNAYAIIIMHNHLSGSTEPSQDDIDITKNIKAAGGIIGIPLLDHVIIGCDYTHTSLKREGII